MSSLAEKTPNNGLLEIQSIIYKIIFSKKKKRKETKRIIIGYFPPKDSSIIKFYIGDTIYSNLCNYANKGYMNL